MEPNDDHIRELYARFGLAYYNGDVLHRALCHLYVMASMPPAGGLRSRFDELYAFADSATLGQIVNLTMPHLPASLQPRLREAVNHRNYLAHHFWFDRIHLGFSTDGVATLLNELDRYSDGFSVLGTDIDGIVRGYHERLGIKEEAFEQASADVRAGRATPIRRERKFKKLEKIVAVHAAPVGDSGSTLVFETDDRQLWLLCDVGLGWSPYAEVEPNWTTVEVLKPFLPVDVNPRPTATKPWHFELDLGGRAALLVRPDPSGQYRWSVRRNGA